MKLRTKLILILIPLIIIQLIVLSSFFYNHLKATAKEMTFAQMKRAIEEVEFHVQSDLKLAAANIDLFSSSELVKRYMLADEETRYSLLQPSILKLFASYSDSYPNYYEIRILLPDGTEDTRFVSSQISNVNENEANSLYFKEMSTSNQSIYTNIFQNPDNNKIAFLISRKLVFSDPITDPTGVKPELKGYLVITMQPAFIEQQLAKLRIGKGGWIFFTDNNGKIVISLYKNELGKNLPENLFKKLTSYNLPKTMLRTIYKEQMSFMEVKKIHSKLFLFAVLPEEELLYEIKTLQIKVGSIAIAGILLTMLLFFFALDIFLINPIHKVAQAARKIGKGNLDINIVSNSNDEIGSLATEFNSMAQSLKDLYNNLEKIVEERTNDLKKTNEELLIAKEISDAAAKAKSEFLANISHEIRTPMNPIINVTRMLLETKLDDEQRDYAELILSSSTTLLNLLNELLDFSKIEAGKITFEHVYFNLRHMIEQISSLMSLKANEKGLYLEIDIEQSVWEHLRGDPMRLRQILLNLLGNAIKFTNKGGITIHIRSEKDDNSKITLKFSIKDTGIGISKKYMQNIFNPFSQEDDSMTRKNGGTGLGLSICKQLVEMMSGQIGVESEKGIGSNFWFTAVFEKDSPSETTKVEKPISIQKQASKIKILVAEDNVPNQIVAKSILEKYGFLVNIAINGNEVLEKLQKENYHIILMDVQMPYMDGYETTRIIRRNYSDIPIIAMTAHALKDDHDLCLKAGMNDYIAKPIDPSEMISVINKYITASDEKIVFDKHDFINRFDSDNILDKKIINLFNENFKEYLINLKTALNDKDVERFNFYSNCIKEISANISAQRLYSIVSEIEFSAKNQDIEILDKELEVLNEKLNS
ncbi:MAG: response regulator [Desulfobacterales bacterium]|nr:response regulator [Desulfobacterales bacterium]